MTGYEAFCSFQSLKLHFTNEKFDYFKYNGKSNVSVNSFENRKDKYYFYKLSRKFPDLEKYCSFIVCNFAEDENIWIGSLLEQKSEEVFLKHQKILQSLTYFFENDCHKVFSEVENPNSVLKVCDGNYPSLLKSYTRGDVSLEVLCKLNEILNFIPEWDKKISDNIMWPSYRRKIIKYTPFLPKEKEKFKIILKKVISK